MMFCSTFSSETSWKDWKMKPMLRRRKMVRFSSRMENRFWPSIRTVPEVGVSRAPMQLSRVLLPEPDSPTTAANSPFSREKDTFFRASTFASPLP